MDAAPATRRFRATIVVLCVTTCLALLLSGWAFYSRFQQTNQFRDAQAHVWHAVICTIEDAVSKSRMPPAKKRAAYRFYDRLLTQDVNAAPCGLAANHPPKENKP